MCSSDLPALQACRAEEKIRKKGLQNPIFHGIMLCVRAKDDASTLGCRQAVRHQTLTLTCVGSNPAIPAKYDPLAQSVEQLPFKQWVWSSNLQRVTKKADTHLGICFLAVWRFENLDVTVLWTVTWHRLDDANSLPGASTPGQRISSGSLRTKGSCLVKCPYGSIAKIYHVIANQ